MKNITIVLTMIGFFLVSCSKDFREDDTIPVENLIPRKDVILTKSQADYVKSGGNEFALNLFKEVAGEEDMVVSPLSVTFALGMADNGALDNTKEQIEQVLGYKESSVDELNLYCKTMMASAAEIDPTVTIEFANAAIINSSFGGKVRDEFTRVIKDSYAAEVCLKHFGKEDVLGYINNWCNLKTHGKIQGILKDQPKETDLAHFLNAVYFKGIWSSQFKKQDSKKEDITDIYGNRYSANIMHQTAHFNYAELPGVCTALSLPFGNQAYHMLFILPANGNVTDLKKTLDINVWNEISSNLYDVKVDVKIPSFEIAFDTSLKPNLQNMGIVDAFNPLLSQFGLMCDSLAWIEDVTHKAVISIDEQGSEAAAITDVKFAVYSSSGIVDDVIRKTFYADRPFLFAITEVSTGAILFMGQYTGIKPE